MRVTITLSPTGTPRLHRLALEHYQMAGTVWRPTTKLRALVEGYLRSGGTADFHYDVPAVPQGEAIRVQFGFPQESYPAMLKFYRRMERRYKGLFLAGVFEQVVSLTENDKQREKALMSHFFGEDPMVEIPPTPEVREQEGDAPYISARGSIADESLELPRNVAAAFSLPDSDDEDHPDAALDAE